MGKHRLQFGSQIVEISDHVEDDDVLLTVSKFCWAEDNVQMVIPRHGALAIGALLGGVRLPPPPPPAPEREGPLAWKVSMQTPHFYFTAYGATEEEANENMGGVIEAHGRQCNLPADWWEPYEQNTSPLFALGYRDGHLIGSSANRLKEGTDHA